jgi:hypothetical protein
MVAKIATILTILWLVMGCTLWGPSGASTFYHPNDYQWVKTSDGRVIPVKKDANLK